jgi:hypothetical protein
MSDTDTPAAEADETPSTEASVDNPGPSFKNPGLWPGMLELVVFVLLCLVHSGISSEIKPQSEDGIGAFAGIVVLMTIIFMVFGRRHKKRTKNYPDHSPLVRIRDLHILCLIGLFSSLTIGLTSEVEQVQEASLTPFGIGIFSLFVVSKIWGALCGTKSYLWGSVFILSGLASAYAGYVSLDPAIEAFKVITEGPEPIEPLTTALSPALLLVGYLLQGVSFIFGGLALFQDEADRQGNQKMLIKFFRMGISAMAYGFILQSISQVPGGLDNEKFVETLTTTPTVHFLVAGLFYWVAGRAMKSHLYMISQKPSVDSAA